ncbi:MAG: helix-turn-helix transcriptional regulator [Pirellulales bacterium]
MADISGDALRGHLETMVLSVLDRGESHGFEIWRRLEDQGKGALRLKEGSLYPALYRLEKAGLVRAEWEKQSEQPRKDNTPRRGARRRIYRITPKGRRRLSEGRQQWMHFVSIIGPIVGASA